MMHYIKKFLHSLERLREASRRRERARQYPRLCEFSDEPDGRCPRRLRYDGSCIRVEGIRQCCNTRMQRAKLNYALIHGTAENMTCTPELRRRMIEDLRNYKRARPDEYKAVFGENDEYGYSCRET